MSGMEGYLIRTGVDDAKQILRAIYPDDNIRILDIGYDENNALPHIKRLDLSGVEFSDVTSGIENEDAQGTKDTLDAGKDDAIGARERIVEFIVEEINSSYPRVWEAVKARDPHL